MLGNQEQEFPQKSTEGRPRLLRHRGLGEVAVRCRMKYRHTVTDGKEKVYRLQFGARRVRLPGQAQPLTLVVVRGFGRSP